MNAARSLVSSSWLRQALNTPASKLRVFETSWMVPGKGHEEYLEKHIPSAHFFDMWKCVKPTQERPRGSHDPECFEKYAQSLGINEDSHIVVYDKGLVFFAARLWYTFKSFGHKNVSVLDGGIVDWETQNFPVESGEAATPPTGNCKLNYQTKSSLFKTFEEVCQPDYKSKTQILDCRNCQFYAGQKPEPSNSTIAALLSAGMDLPRQTLRGHIPGAKNLEYEKLVDQTTRCIVPAERILQMLKEAGIDPQKPVTSMCYNGIAACLVPLALSKIDKDDVSVYLGSWTEYSQRASTDMVEADSSTANQPVSGG